MWRGSAHSYFLLCEARMLLLTIVVQLLGHLHGHFPCVLAFSSSLPPAGHLVVMPHLFYTNFCLKPSKEGDV